MVQAEVPCFARWGDYGYVGVVQGRRGKTQIGVFGFSQQGDYGHLVMTQGVTVWLRVRSLVSGWDSGLRPSERLWPWDMALGGTCMT